MQTKDIRVEVLQIAGIPVSFSCEIDFKNTSSADKFETYQLFKLNLDAHKLSLFPAFDTLLALNLSRGIVPFEHQINSVKKLLLFSPLHGGLSRHEKEKSIKEFQHTTKALVATDVGSEGRNLQFCNHIINFDLPWNPMKIEQRIGRISRIGQEKEVHVTNLSAKDTIEDHILYLLDAKINMFELVIGEIDVILGRLLPELLKKLR